MAATLPSLLRLGKPQKPSAALRCHRVGTLVPVGVGVVVAFLGKPNVVVVPRLMLAPELDRKSSLAIRWILSESPARPRVSYLWLLKIGPGQMIFGDKWREIFFIF
jgi:hypothetical protein